MKNKLLFELGLEEIPADMIEPALDQMRACCQELLSGRQVSCQTIRTFASPRRLAVLLEGLPDFQPTQEQVIIGPPRSIAYDEENRPTRAAEGFARKNNADIDELEIVETERGPYLAYRQKIPGKPTPETLVEILPEIVGSISWPKNMYWRESRFGFVRPLRWFVALWNDQVLQFEFEGIEAGKMTRGHRFLGQREVPLTHGDHYLQELRKNYVLADVQERREKIRSELRDRTPQDLLLVPDVKLEEMVVHLNEYPTVIRGKFSSRFLKLPREVLITVMRHHQKYFAVMNEKEEIQPYFLTVLNTKGDPTGKVREGHERVLKARLEDAAFFWGVDAKRPLIERLDDLEHVLFQETLGTFRAKAERLQAFCSALSGDPHLDSAARLCKVDLTTEMVGEFPELQGVVGGLYAREQGYPEEVWRAVYEHYKPRSLGDKSPSTDLGALLSIADKLDTMVGCYGAGIIPSGSSDPFALRRQAQGLVKVLLDHQFNYSLAQLVKLAEKGFPDAVLDRDVYDDLLEFLQGRVRRILGEEGIPYDVLNAVLAVETCGVHDAFARAKALLKIRKDEDFEALAVAYKRVKNILEEQTINIPHVSEELLLEPEEQALFRAFSDLHHAVDGHLENRNYVDALKEIAGLRTPVDQFFDKVLVMAEEVELRGNRLRLLHEISQLFLKVADISQIVQENPAAKLEMPVSEG